MGGVSKKKPTDQAYEMGYKAFLIGVLNSPYKVTSVLHKEWQRGFDAAYLQNLRVRGAI